ncbi:MAG TPA: UbiD family decarboxylase, partial [Verrucomicrobiota bacterium]|nr:UbiD family decarboxylase [Verrucomicrobiota bacterium]
MPFDSFRDWIQHLNSLGELRRVSQPLASELEITAVADREMKSPGGGKALLIEKPTVNGEVSPFPVAINTLGSWRRMAASMGGRMRRVRARSSTSRQWRAVRYAESARFNGMSAAR